VVTVAGSAEEPEARHHRVLVQAPSDERARRMSTPPTRLLPRAVAVVLLGSLIAAAACGGDDDEVGPGTTRPRGDGTTSTTEPPGTEPADVQPYITNLLARYDELTNQIVAEPSVATDRNSRLIRDYLALVEPGSDAEGAIETWVDSAAQGITIRPYSDDAPAFATSVNGEIETVSEDEVTVPTCETQNYRRYDGQGRETEFVTEQSVPGEATAVRVGGQWRLRRIDIASNVVGCGGAER
jgi:hypothetical protein